MSNFEMLDIDLRAITEDSKEFTLVLDDRYFQALDDAEIQHGTVTTTVLISKMPSEQFALSFSIEGNVTIPCDLCLDDMEQPIKGQCSYIVKLGRESSVDILSLPWIIYETIVLAIPIKHVHAPGKCNAAMTQKLKELSATRSGDEDVAIDNGDNTSGDDTIDPRWAALKQFKD